jgi:SAM-dependent methyltransferase
MDNQCEGYAPGWDTDVMAMLHARTADERAAFALPFLRSGFRVLDIGCGPGAITLGLARRVLPHGKCVGVDVQPSQIDAAQCAADAAGATNVSFQTGNAYHLPLTSASFDVVFAHALFEHVAEPQRVLGEMSRVLRPSGVIAVCSSDWSGAHIEPDSEDVRCALQGHFMLRRRAGGDPFAGGRLAEWVSAAGFSIVQVGANDRVDMGYTDIARYVAARLDQARADVSTADSLLEQAAAAAGRWAKSGVSGRATQRWVHVVGGRV